MPANRDVSLRAAAYAAAAGTLLVVVTGTGGLGAAHLVLAALTVVPLVGVVVFAWSERRDERLPAAVAFAAFVGAAVAPSDALHVAAAATSFAAASLVVVRLVPRRDAHGAGWHAYLTLTKPRVMSLLLLTGACGVFVGARRAPSPELLVTTLVGLALACGGASAFNHVLDRDIDRLMGARTRSRPLAADRLPVAAAVDFAVVLSAASFVVLAAAVNVLTAVLALVGNLFYVLVYTRLLKRRTAQNIVIGGAAGAVPPVVGYAAATGTIALPALWLFLIVFLWTPPHFWALALLLRNHYANARVPMLPVVRGIAATTRQIAGYSVVLLAVSYAPVAAGELGLPYALASTALGVPFLWLAMRLARDAAPRRAAQLFHYSLLYLALLFVAMAVDVTL